MSKRPPKQILKHLNSAIKVKVEARKGLTLKEHSVVALRALLELIPHGIGAALGQGYFGTLDARRLKKIEETVAFIDEQVLLLHNNQAVAVTTDYFSTDEFASLFEECWRRILAEGERAKLNALRSALVSVIIDRPRFEFSKKEFFIKSLDGMAATHVQVLQVMRGRFRHTSDDTFGTLEIYRLLLAEDAAQRDYVYAALDVLANRRYIVPSNIPQIEDGQIDYDRQRFRLTSLGAEFLDFVRLNAI